PHRGRLARAVWPEEAEDLSPLGREGDPVERGSPPESLGELLNLDDSHGRRPRGARGPYRLVPLWKTGQPLARETRFIRVRVARHQVLKRALRGRRVPLPLERRGDLEEGARRLVALRPLRSHLAESLDRPRRFVPREITLPDPVLRVVREVRRGEA